MFVASRQHEEGSWAVNSEQTRMFSKLDSMNLSIPIYANNRHRLGIVNILAPAPSPSTFIIPISARGRPLAA